jgi:hypothetical protein
MKEILKKYYPLLILILCCLIFTYNYSSRLILPLDDETVYVQGLFRSNPEWGPLYSFYYFILNFFTGYPFWSLYFNYFLLTFIFIPASFYLTLRNLNFNVKASSLAGFIALVSFWNYPSDTKVQIFNFLFILLAFNIRWYFDKYNRDGRFYFYLILSILVFARFDNLIIILISLVWDFLFSKAKLKTLLYVPMIVLIVWSGVFIFGNIFLKERSLHIFLDHFYYNNPEVFSSYTKAFVPKELALAEVFNHPKSILSIVINNPTYFFSHVYKNFLLIPKQLPFLFSFSLKDQWNYKFLLKPYFAFMCVFVFSFSITKKNFMALNFREIYLFTFAMLVKCFTVSLILDWWIKYYFELSLVFIIWVSITLFYLHKIRFNDFFSKYKIKLQFLNYLWLLLPFTFLAYKFYVVNPVEEVRLQDVLEVLNIEDKKMPVKNIISGHAIIYYSNLKLNPYSLFFDRQFDAKVHASLKEFLLSEKIDTVVLYNEERRRLAQVGFKESFLAFEDHPENFGFTKVYDNSRHQCVYRILTPKSL